MEVILGIDIGGSTTKIVGLRTDGSVVSMLRVRAEDQVTSLYGALGNYLASNGLSLGDVRRMRDFWQLYGGMPELLCEALHLNWTQNMVIMEAELAAEERYWYIQQAAAQNLSKSELLQMITDSAYLESALDEKVDVWYNEGNDEISERTQYEEDPVYLPRQYLPQPHGRVRDEGLDTKGRVDVAVSYRISSYQPGRDWQPGLSSGTAQAGGA